jgi:hypothetical protein
VLDSLTFLADAAFDWREALTKSATGGKYDKRMVYYDAQNAVENVLALLTGESFRTNVIVITHIRYTDNPTELKKVIQLLLEAHSDQLSRDISTLLLSAKPPQAANAPSKPSPPR